MKELWNNENVENLIKISQMNKRTKRTKRRPNRGNKWGTHTQTCACICVCNGVHLPSYTWFYICIRAFVFIGVIRNEAFNGTTAQVYIKNATAPASILDTIDATANNFISSVVLLTQTHAFSMLHICVYIHMYISILQIIKNYSKLFSTCQTVKGKPQKNFFFVEAKQ